MATYVQGHGSDAWHWCTNCTQYPSSIAKTSHTRPDSDLCNQCKSKERDGECKS